MAEEEQKQVTTETKKQSVTEAQKQATTEAKVKQFLFNHRFKWQYAVAAAVILVGAAVGGFKLWLSSQGNNEGFAVSGNRVVRVKSGMTTADVAQLLHDKKLVKNPRAFQYAARLDGLASKLQAGLYQIKGGMTNEQIIDTMVKGRVQYVKFVIPEGYSIKKIAEKLQAEELGEAEKFLAAAKDYAPYDYMQTDNPAVKYKAEGFTFPATYDFPASMEEAKMLEYMVNIFDKKMEQEGIKQEVADRQLNLRDVVTMASMVELEAVFEEEQPRIAGVFERRVKIDMPIQSDTTIQYLLGKQKEVVLYKDLEIDSPYNTYKNPGLPPGPIGSPGISAIKAVLHPEETEYLYFVAEKDGHHRFTKTYVEHQQAIDDIEAGK